MSAMKTGYKVCDVMTRKPVEVTPDTSIVDCARIMAENHVGSLVVRENKKIVGLLTEKDIVRKIVARGFDLEKISAKDAMNSSFVSISPEKDIYDALVLMRDHNVRQVPVMSGKKMVGFLTGKDILKIQPQLFELLADKIELREQDRKLRLVED